MSLEISPTTEHRLADEARKLGISVDALLEQLLKVRNATNGAGTADIPELPSSRLGVKGELHGRDIYTDAG